MRAKRDSRISKPLLLICMLFAVSLSSSAPAQSGAAGQWTWMGGSNTVPSDGLLPGLYGQRGVPSRANIPAGRVGAATWTDKDGRLWLFGGMYPLHDGIWLNDMWEFDPSTGEWTWVSGSGASTPCIQFENATWCGEPGVYGKLGEPAAKNTPGGREYAAGWSDKDGYLWLFGGDGFDAEHRLGVLNDLWKFDPETRQWTWVDGGSVIPGTGYGPAGVYGTKGEPAHGNNPGGLDFANVWTDNSGNAWLFGGTGFDEDGIIGLPNNMWTFDQSKEEWAWIEGYKVFDTPWVHLSSFGVKGRPGPGNTPGSRWQAASWTDAAGNLWMFGGDGFDAEANQGYLNELWMYDPSAKEWTYMAGIETMSCPPNADKQNCGRAGIYGTMGTPSTKNLPGGRTAPAFWRASDGSFWLFGGAGFNARGQYSWLNDLWRFDPDTREWTWVGGTDGAGYGGGIFGTLGVPSPENIPGVRHDAAMWTGKDGAFWLFGGNAEVAIGAGIANDFWRYQPPVAAH